jgi:hypothetical protein
MEDDKALDILSADLTVNLSPGNGNAIIFNLGTAVYTRSVPDLIAAIEASRGAP